MKLKINSSICETGCNVSSLFIRTTSQGNGLTGFEPIMCRLNEEHGLSAGETAYISENNTCQVVTCNVSEYRNNYDFLVIRQPYPFLIVNKVMVEV